MSLPTRKEPKTRKVMMLWTEKMYMEVKSLAEQHNISVSEVSRHAINQLLETKHNKEG